MAKKLDVLQNVVTLLGNLQKRLSKVGLQASQTHDGLAALRDEVRLKVGQLTERTTGMQVEMDRAWALNKSRTELVAKINTDLKARLDETKAATQRGFDGVRLDMERALRTIQNLNVRVSEVESKATAASTYGSEVEQRIASLEADLALIRKFIALARGEQE
jgi:chromosome segregation ATPase